MSNAPFRKIVRLHLPNGRDPDTGMVLESIRWALGTLSTQKPEKVEDLAHWLNMMAGLADALLRAGGTRDELRAFEGGGFTLNRSFWDEVGAAERVRS